MKRTAEHVKACPHCNATCFDCLSQVAMMFAGDRALAWCWGCGVLYEWVVTEAARTHPQIIKRAPALTRSKTFQRFIHRYPLKATDGRVKWKPNNG